jgi:hypothetical protein
VLDRLYEKLKKDRKIWVCWDDKPRGGMARLVLLEISCLYLGLNPWKDCWGLRRRREQHGKVQEPVQK